MNEARQLESEERLHTWEQLLIYSLQEDVQRDAAADWIVRCYNRVESTMNNARELLPQLKAGQSAIVLAAEQTQGRGRMGRNWLAAHDGFYATFVFCDQLEIGKLSGFSLVVGTVLRQVFLELGCDTYLKWPNDVLAQDGRKLSGVLIEVLPADEFGFVLVGIGVNLRGAPVNVGNAVALEELCAKKIIATDLAALLAPRLHTAWKIFMKNGFAAFRQQWISAAFHLGRQIKISLTEQMLEGKFIGVNEYGSLLLETDAGQQQVSCGEVLC